MLNRELGNTDWSRTFGVGRRDLVPRLILLDEIHTYQGVAGAQTAWLLRRWRHWTRARKTHYVGLSATLADGTAHLSKVAGLPVGDTIIDIAEDKTTKLPDYGAITAAVTVEMKNGRQVAMSFGVTDGTSGKWQLTGPPGTDPRFVGLDSEGKQVWDGKFAYG